MSAVVLMVFAFAAVGWAQEDESEAAGDEVMVDGGNILILITGSPNANLGYTSYKVDPDEGDSETGSNLSLLLGARLGYFISRGFAFGVSGHLGYRSEEVVDDTFADDAVTTFMLGAGVWVGYFAYLDSWFIPYVGAGAGLDYESTDDPNNDVTYSALGLGAQLFCGTLLNFASNWALNLEIDWGYYDQGFAVGLAVAF